MKSPLCYKIMFLNYVKWKRIRPIPNTNFKTYGDNIGLIMQYFMHNLIISSVKPQLFNGSNCVAVSPGATSGHKRLQAQDEFKHLMPQTSPNG